MLSMPPASAPRTRHHRLLSPVLSAMLVGLASSAAFAAADEPMPFQSDVEVYRSEEGDVMVFALRLEQPFLAEEFEKSNYLRLSSLDRGSYLIYPKEARFEQKHAEFYGRLRGDGKARLRLSYEIVSENLDGSRKVDVRVAELEVGIPREETGPESIYRSWANQQNDHFRRLLDYYPDETFFQYVLLQSRDRYEVAPPPFRQATPSRSDVETGLYYLLSGGLTMQHSLQRRSLEAGASVGDLTIPIRNLAPPSLGALPYEELLEEKRSEGIEPRIHPVSRLIPEDQYLLHLHSLDAANSLVDLTGEWGDRVLRLVTGLARRQQLLAKFERQLCIDRKGLERLFAEGAVTELTLTGSDIFFAEGTDLTLVLRVKDPEAFRRESARWVEAARQRQPQLRERGFNYRGHRVIARYVEDRMESSFLVDKGEHVIVSNSQTATRKMIDTAAGLAPNLGDALDYRYITTILPPPPAEDRAAGYLYASDAFLRRLVSPGFKISEKRRLQCFNHLVMLNNASLFYRLETGRSPETLSDLVVGKFIDPEKLVCPHGGAYAFDAERDTCTCSLHNRIKYLTPNVELPVLRVSSGERQEYERYKQRYRDTWQGVFDPVAVRIGTEPRIRFEAAVLPFANGPLYTELRGWVDETPQALSTDAFAESAILSLSAVSGRDRIRTLLRSIPGMSQVLDADPTLAALDWLGDRVSVHFCDADTILEIDPLRLRPLGFLGDASVVQQAIVAGAITATSLPLYLTVDVEDERKAQRLLDSLSSRIFLEDGQVGGLTTSIDAYRLPDYQGHAVHVFSYRLYALKVRLYVSLAGGRLAAATRLETLRDVIDAARNERQPANAGDAEAAREAHLLLRLNRDALDRLKDEIRIYWAERCREACHRNIMSIYNLVRLYEIPVDSVDKLSDAKYGVRYFCPEGGHYSYDGKRDRVSCSVHGNRREARQLEEGGRSASFDALIESIEEIVLTLRFEEDAMIATLEVERGKADE